MLRPLDTQDDLTDKTQKSESKNLPTEMAGFLENFLERNPTKAKENEEGDVDDIAQKLRQRVHYLMENAERYERAVADFEQPYIFFGEPSEKKLEEAVNGNGAVFNEELLSHYAELEKKVRTIITGINKGGANYLVDDDGNYREEAARGVENLYRTMISGWRELNRGVLEERNPDYATVKIGTAQERSDDYRKYMDITPDNKRERRYNAETFEYKREQQMLHEIIEMLTGDEKTPEDVRKKMLELTKSMLLHMSDDLAGNSSILFESHTKEPEKRNLIVLKEPLEQLDYMLDVIIRCVRVVSNTRMHTEMLVQGKNRDKLGQTFELPSEEELIRLIG